jgi:hypothetical protein
MNTENETGHVGKTGPLGVAGVPGVACAGVTMIGWPADVCREFVVPLGDGLQGRVLMLVEEDGAMPTPCEPERWVGRRPEDLEVVMVGGSLRDFGQMAMWHANFAGTREVTGR